LRSAPQRAIAAVLDLLPPVGLVAGDHAQCWHERATIYPTLYGVVTDLIVERPEVTAAREVFIDERLRDYMVALVTATRKPREIGLVDLAPLIAFGASPRATLAFSEASRAIAFLRGRGYVIPEDVKEIAKDVLRHRILLTYEAEAENVTTETVVDQILEHVEVP